MFSKDFVWGAATAAYQIEGGAYEDGKGLSFYLIHIGTSFKGLQGIG